MTYYVEPDYWVSGYAVGDSTGTLVYGSGASAATGEVLSGANYRVASIRGIAMGQSSVLSAGDLIAIFPGVTIYGNSDIRSGSNVTMFGAAESINTSDTKASGRIFWEITAPTSGTWVQIVPQSEGSGE